MQPSRQEAKKAFCAMSLTYFLGVFNDNYFKQALLLLAVAAGMNHIQGQATVLFSLPFVLFSAWGGWLADRFTKKKVVIAVKGLELIAMLIGAYGLLSGNWACVLTMLFLMGLQSTLFNPALNGSIPELYAPEHVTKANALLKFVTTTAILLGIALAGFSLDQGVLLVACIVVTMACLGLVASFWVYSRPASGAKTAFPWAGPLHSLRDLLALRGDPLLLLAIFCDCFFYFVSLLVILVINTLGLQQLGLNNSQTSLLSVAMMIGVCFGSLLAARISNQQRWTHVLGPGAFGMGLSLLAIGLLISFSGTNNFTAILALFALAGLFGGLFLIPVTSFIQVRPEPQCKGKVIGADNFAAFTGMIVAGQLFPFLDTALRPSAFLMLLGLSSVAVALLLWFVLTSRLFTQKIS
jgi:acyl-[acyl-carrier-protein]-phospholipid O-acyltransferase / long-chain-fatty-acid--[acyl-carrier-protein] ligase